MSSKGDRDEARDLEKNMRGYATKKTILDEEPPVKKASRRKLREVRFQRAEGGFLAHPEWESKGSSGGNAPMPAAQPHVIKDRQGLHDFIDEHFE